MIKGSLHKPKNRPHYYVVLDTIDPATGKRKRPWINTKETDPEKAKVAYHRIMAEVNEGKWNPDAEKTTVKEVLLYWLNRKRIAVDIATAEWYELIVEKHLVPGLGAIRVKELTSDHVTEFYAHKFLNGSLAKRKKGDEEPKGLGAGTVRHLHKILSMALHRAVRQGIIPLNPCHDAELPEDDDEEVEYWSPEESRHFLAVAKQMKSPYYLYYRTLLTTGMRPGEGAALKWPSVVFRDNVIIVRNSLRKPRFKNDRIKRPKTKAGWRRIDVPDLLMDALREHKERQEEARRNFEGEYYDHDLVFCKANGEPFNPDNIQRRNFQTVTKEAGLKRIKLKGLRHSHATELLMRGVPVLAVSERLGHTDPAFTQKQYGHVIPSLQKSVAAMLDDLT